MVKVANQDQRIYFDLDKSYKMPLPPQDLLAQILHETCTMISCTFKTCTRLVHASCIHVSPCFTFASLAHEIFVQI